MSPLPPRPPSPLHLLPGLGLTEGSGGASKPPTQQGKPRRSPCGHLPGPGLASEQEDKAGAKGTSVLPRSLRGRWLLPPTLPASVQRRGQSAFPFPEGGPTAIGTAAASPATVRADLSLRIHRGGKEAPLVLREEASCAWEAWQRAGRAPPHRRQSQRLAKALLLPATPFHTCRSVSHGQGCASHCPDTSVGFLTGGPDGKAAAPGLPRAIRLRV